MTITAYNLNYFKKISTINYFLIALYITVSITAHTIANRLIVIDAEPIISAGLIYMSIFVLTDVFAAFNSRRFVIGVIFLEALCNLIFISYTNWISHLPAPSFFHHRADYQTVFSPMFVLFFANLVGTIVAAILDLFVFYYLYIQRKWHFLLASFFSSFIILSCYTYITDYFGFRHSYPEHVFQLTFINLISNVITLAAYSLLGQFLVWGIHRYVRNVS